MFFLPRRPVVVSTISVVTGTDLRNQQIRLRVRFCQLLLQFAQSRLQIFDLHRIDWTRCEVDPGGVEFNLPISRLNTLRRAVFKEILRESDASLAGIEPRGRRVAELLHRDNVVFRELL